MDNDSAAEDGRVTPEILADPIILKPAVERGPEIQIIQPAELAQKPRFTHRVSLRFYVFSF